MNKETVKNGGKAMNNDINVEKNVKGKDKEQASGNNTTSKGNIEQVYSSNQFEVLNGVVENEDQELSILKGRMVLIVF